MSSQLCAHSERQALSWRALRSPPAGLIAPLSQQAHRGSLCLNNKRCPTHETSSSSPRPTSRTARTTWGVRCIAQPGVKAIDGPGVRCADGPGVRCMVCRRWPNPSVVCMALGRPSRPAFLAHLHHHTQSTLAQPGSQAGSVSGALCTAQSAHPPSCCPRAHWARRSARSLAGSCGSGG